jgi:hypothetical protein
VPKGIYRANEENTREIEFEEEGKIPDQGELATLESWVHYNPHILNSGRVTHYIDPSLPEEVFYSFRTA